MKTNLYKGVFNFQGEIWTLYTHAFSVRQAKSNFANQLASKLNRTSYFMRQYFNGSSCSWSISEVEEVRDDITEEG